MREDEILKRVVERIKSRYSIVAIILFGSRARGDWGPWSDYDLLIIGDFREDYIDRIRRITQLVEDLGLPIEPHPYTVKEVLEMLRKGVPSIIDALEEGITLYSTRDYDKIIEAYKNLKKKGLRRTQTTIVVPEQA